MPKIAMTVTPGVLAQETVDVDPEIVAKLEATLATYHDLKMQRDLLDEAMDAEVKKIRGEMDLLGVKKLEIGGTPCTLVEGTSSKLDKMKFVALGGSLEMLKRATISKPKKAYLRVGAARDEED